MIHDDPVTQQRPMRKLEHKIRSFAYELLSTSDYPESLEIATDLIAVIYTLLEARSQSGLTGILNFSTPRKMQASSSTRTSFDLTLRTVLVLAFHCYRLMP